jgi:hypothetical protein
VLRTCISLGPGLRRGDGERHWGCAWFRAWRFEADRTTSWLSLSHCLRSVPRNESAWATFTGRSEANVHPTLARRSELSARVDAVSERVVIPAKARRLTTAELVNPCFVLAMDSGLRRNDVRQDHAYGQVLSSKHYTAAHPCTQEREQIEASRRSTPWRNVSVNLHPSNIATPD